MINSKNLKILNSWSVLHNQAIKLYTKPSEIRQIVGFNANKPIIKSNDLIAFRFIKESRFIIK